MDINNISNYTNHINNNSNNKIIILIVAIITVVIYDNPKRSNFNNEKPIKTLNIKETSCNDNF